MSGVRDSGPVFRDSKVWRVPTGTACNSWMDATAKRNYNYFVICEWDERKRNGNLEKHGLDKERRLFDAALKDR